MDDGGLSRIEAPLRPPTIVAAQQGQRIVRGVRTPRSGVRRRRHLTWEDEITDCAVVRESSTAGSCGCRRP